MNELSWTVRREPGRAVVVTNGVVTIATSGEFEPVLVALAAETDLVVDLRALELVDSTGLSVFVAAYKAGAEHGNTVVLDPVPRFLQRVLEVTGLDSLLLAPRPVP